MYRESVYVQDITKSIEKGTKSTPTKYTMTDQNYQEISQDENINDEIDTVTPEDQQRKIPAQLMSTVSGFMINEIARMPKTTGQKKASKKSIELITVQIKWLRVLLNTSIKLEDDRRSSNHLKN